MGEWSYVLSVTLMEIFVTSDYSHWKSPLFSILKQEKQLLMQASTKCYLQGNILGS
jgi:hypothetical protein